MSKIFKFFPMAAAALALASCSGDDLLDSGDAQEFKFEKGKLYVQVDGESDASTTRSGFATVIQDYGMDRALTFMEGDEFKVYHDTNNWRPQIWTCTEKYNQYKGTEGFNVFEKAEDDNTEFDQYSEAYGIYPAELAQFGNEYRTSLYYDMSGLQLMEYKVTKDQEVDYNGKTLKDDADHVVRTYKATFPLWGRKSAGEDVMKASYMTGILRVDMANMTAAAVNQKHYMVIKSKTSKLWGKYQTAVDLLNPTEEEAIDPAGLIKIEGAPELRTPTYTSTTKNTATIWNGTDAVPVVKGQIKENTIIVDLGRNGEHVMVWVPVPVGETGIEVYRTTTAVSVDALQIESSNLTKVGEVTTESINERNAKATPAAPEDGLTHKGVVYLINDDSGNLNTTAATPFELTKAIIDADSKAFRDFEITFTRPIVVKNDDSAPQNKWIDFTNTVSEYGLDRDAWSLKHNVTVNVTITGGGDKDNKVAKCLFIRTAEGTKTLTLNIKNEEIENVNGSKVDSIVIEKATDLQSPLVLQADEESTNQLPDIRNASSKLLTIKTPVDYVKTSGELTIDIAAETLDTESEDKVGTLVLTGAVGAINLKNGLIGEIQMNAKEALTGDVTIRTEGLSQIGTVDMNNMPIEAVSGKYSDKYKLYFESTWDGESKAEGLTTIKNGNFTVFDANVVTTAAALAQGDHTDNEAYLLGTFNLGNKPWASNILTSNLTGAEYIGRYQGSTNNKDDNNPKNVESATITNLFGENGLFKEITVDEENVTVRNLVFKNCTVEAVPANKNSNNNIGLLAGMTSGSEKVVEIINIVVKETNSVVSKDVALYANNAVAGVIGKTGVETKLAGVTVEKGAKVEGFKNVGGIVGDVAAETTFAVYDGTTLVIPITNTADKYSSTHKYCSAEADLTTHFVSTNTDYHENMAKKGQLVGSITTNNATVTVYQEKNLELNSWTANSEEQWSQARITSTSEPIPFQIHRGTDQIGLYGVKSVNGSGLSGAPAADTNYENKVIWTYRNGTQYQMTAYNGVYVGNEQPTAKKYLHWIDNTVRYE